MKPLRLIVLLIAALALGACHRGGDRTALPFSAKLVKAANASDLELRVKSELTRRYQRMGDGYLLIFPIRRGHGTICNRGLLIPMPLPRRAISLLRRTSGRSTP